MDTDTQVKQDIAQLRVNGSRLWDSLMELAQIGATPKGGVCRLTLTDLDRQGRDLVTRWAREAGMTVTIDKIGNGFMRRPGRDNSLPPIMTGSHIDTQPTGGKFDGNYGVLAGLEVVRTLNDHGIETEAPIEVAFWTNEEGSRFVPVMMGSGVFAKAFTLEHAYAATDSEGKTVKGELERIGYVGSQEPETTRSAPTSNPISSRARCWRTTPGPLAWLPACWASAGMTAWSRAWRPMPAPRPWPCARMRCKWPRS